VAPHTIDMSKDDFDKLFEGKQFDRKREGRLIDGKWVDAQLTFETHRLEYVVTLNWGDDFVTETYESKVEALNKYHELIDKHDLYK
jgi:hypothetical protein